ncbi:MAG: hypothetical protein RJA61_339 [Candidatus Parcubacteria bacterium]|jgi:dCTP deaminase
MSIITKKQILERIQSGSITFSPNLDTFQLQAHAVDLRLGFTFLIPKRWHMTIKGREALNMDHFSKEKAAYYDVIELEQGQHFELLPGEYVSVNTLESVKIPDDLMAILYPRSSTNRKGLSVDLTGIVDSGYEGQLTVPIRNNTSSQIIKLYPGERFCQLVFEELNQKIEIQKSRYHKKDIIEGYVRKNDALGKKDETEIELVTKGEIKKLKKEHPVL